MGTHTVIKGPLNETLGILATHLSCLAGRAMVFDPDAAGTQTYGETGRGRYQFKVEGGRGSDYQGVALLIGSFPEFYFIRRNHIEVIVRLSDRNFTKVGAAIREDVGTVLPSTFGAVLEEMMVPYVLPHEEAP